MEPLIHFIIPFTVLILLGLRFKEALPLSLLALTPDLDVFFHVHRSPTHSILILLLPFILLSPLIWRFKLQKYTVLAFLVLASHPLLDMFAGYTPTFWPLYGQSIWVVLESTAKLGSIPNLALNLKILTTPTIFTYSETFEGEIFTSQGIIISTLLLLTSLVKAKR